MSCCSAIGSGDSDKAILVYAVSFDNGDAPSSKPSSGSWTGMGCLKGWQAMVATPSVGHVGLWAMLSKLGDGGRKAEGGNEVGGFKLDGKSPPW